MKEQEMTEGLEFLCSQSRLIAMLPLEDWDRAFDTAETIAPITDPTLYQKYLYSDKAKVARKIIKAAIKLKQVVLEAQPIVKKEMERERECLPA